MNVSTPSDPKPVFQLAGVTKTYDNIIAVDGLDLSIQTGTTTVLIGPSGCGKSTLLRLMNGLIWPDCGTVTFEGQPLSKELLPLQRRRMGYVIQEGGLFPHLTARENVTIMAQYLGWPVSQTVSRLTELCDLTHFPGDGLARYPAELSGGQRQRVSLMRALMLDPDGLLLDEPLGALDPMIRSELQDDLRTIFRQLQKTVVLVTHDLSEAVWLGDMLVLMRDGVIVQQGSSSDLLNSPTDDFVTRFIRAQRFDSALIPTDQESGL